MKDASGALVFMIFTIVITGGLALVFGFFWWGLKGLEEGFSWSRHPAFWSWMLIVCSILAVFIIYVTIGEGWLLPPWVRAAMKCE